MRRPSGYAPPLRLKHAGNLPGIPPMDDRIVTLETKLMAAEDLLDELNRTVWRQQQELDLLREQVRQLAQQVKTIQPANPLRPEDEIPPHW